MLNARWQMVGLFIMNAHIQLFQVFHQLLKLLVGFLAIRCGRNDCQQNDCYYFFHVIED